MIEKEEVTVTTATLFKTTDLKPRIGTLIEADVDALVRGHHSARIRELLEQRGVLVFRGINMDDAQQLAFTETLGEAVRHGGEVFQKITLDTKVSPTAEYLKGSFFWHIDGAVDGNLPNLAAMLRARQLSATGGDTYFANTYAAWDDLPPSEQQALEKLKVVHSIEATQRYVYPEPSYKMLQAWQSFGERIHPLVWTHQSGRKSLVLGSTASHVEGMSLAEGRALLSKLLDWATQPERVYVHQWQLGDLLIWDNTGTMHKVSPYEADSGRLMHRTTLAGEEALV